MTTGWDGTKQPPYLNRTRMVCMVIEQLYAKVRWHKAATILTRNRRINVMHGDITYDKARWHKSAIILIITRTIYLMCGDRTYAKVRWHKSATILKQKRMLCVVTERTSRINGTKRSPYLNRTMHVLKYR